MFLKGSDGICVKKGISDIFLKLFSEKVRREEQQFVFFSCWALLCTSRHLWDACNHLA